MSSIVVGRWISAAVNYCMRCDDGRLTWLDIDASPAAAAAAAAAGRTRRRRTNRTRKRPHKRGYFTAVTWLTAVSFVRRSSDRLRRTRQRSSDVSWHRHYCRRHVHHRHRLLYSPEWSQARPKASRSFCFATAAAARFWAKRKKYSKTRGDTGSVRHGSVSDSETNQRNYTNFRAN